jgi:hypothetical protein
LAGCATDDLAGWTERKDGEAVRQAGILDGFELSREECEALIMQARLKAGWVTEADLAPPPPVERRRSPRRSRNGVLIRHDRSNRHRARQRTA